MFSQLWCALVLALHLGFLIGIEAANCTVGEYRGSDGACLPCSEGRYRGETSHTQTSCELCAAGTWAPITGMSACFDCPANSASLAGASSCDYDPPDCSPCIDRSTVKIRVVSHGQVTDAYWKRMVRVMTVAGQLMNVNLVVKLGYLQRLSEMQLGIENALEEEPDAIIVTLPSSDLLETVQRAAQIVPVFSFNTGTHLAKSAGSLGHIGMNESNAGYGCGEQFQSKFSSAGITFSACLVFYDELDNEAMDQRMAGFGAACSEIGAVSLTPVSLSGADDSEREAAVKTEMSTFLAGHTNVEGLAVLLLSESLFTASLAAWRAVGEAENIKIGTFDLPAGLDAGIASGGVAFGVDGGEFMQGYLAVVLASIYLTTGQALAMDLFQTGPTYVTEPRDADVALRALEGYPICDCPWVGGLEDILKCGPDLQGIEAIGDCPLDSCSSPCLDIRKFSVQGVIYADEQSTFFFPMKAGAEQAGHDFRLINHKLDFFKPSSTGYADAYSEAYELQTIANLATDDSVDGVWCGLLNENYFEPVQAVAAVKPVVNVNSGYYTSETLKTSSNHMLHFVGQDEASGGREAARALINAGATRVLCLAWNDNSVSVERCLGAEEVCSEFNVNYTYVELWLDEFGGYDTRSDTVMAGSVVNALEKYPDTDSVISLGGRGWSFISKAWTDSGRSLGDLKYATFDVDENVMDLVASGDIIMGNDQQPYMQGYMAVLMLGIYHMSGNSLMDYVIKSGPMKRDSPRTSDECSQVYWTTLVEGSLTDPIVGTAFLPSFDPALTYGFPVCEREGTCDGTGSYFNTTTATCMPCPAGTYANSSMVACEECPAGFSTGGNGGSSECYACGKGLFSSAQGAAACEYCPVGTFTATEGLSECESCRSPFSTAAIARQTPDDCMCPEGLYGVNGNYTELGSSCAPCPEGLLCPFGSHEDYGTRPVAALQFPDVQVGYMTLQGRHLEPYRCLTEAWCPGGELETCAPFRDSSKVACGTCLEGYFLSDDGCTPCENTISVGLVLTICVCVALVIGTTLLANMGSHLRGQSNLIIVIMASLIFTNLQALSVFDNFSFEWFEPVKTMLEKVGEISLNVQLVRGACILKLDSVAQFLLLQLAIPICLPACTIVVMAKKFNPIERFRLQNTDVATEVTTAVGSLMGMFFIPVLMSCLSPFVCYSHPGTAGSSVRAAPEILCGWEGQHLQMGITAIVSLLVVPLPFFANACNVTYQYSKSMALEARRDVLLKYRFLFFRFQPHAYYYGLLLVVRSLLICLVPVVIRDDAGMQIFVVGVVVICFAELQIYLQPWRAPICNGVDALLGLFLLSLLLSAPMAVGIKADGRPLQTLGFCALLGMILVAALSLLFGVVKYFRRSPYYDIFLCHHKEHAAAQVRYLKTCIANMSNYNVFIDSDNLVNLDRLFDTVKNHIGLFIVYLTASTLRRAWCCGEVVSAFAAKVPTKTIHTRAFVPPTAEQLESLDVYVSHLDDTLSHYGISLVAVQNAIEALLNPATPRQVLSSTTSGTNRFLTLARTLLNHRETGSKSASACDVAISSACDDDEAVAAAGYIAVKLRLLLAQYDDGGDVHCLCDCQAPVSKVSDFGEARAAVILFSAASLRDIEHLTSIVGIMEAHLHGGTPAVAIPVHLPGFNFPTQHFFEEELEILWAEHAGLESAKEVLQFCFKTISISLETGASDAVLSTQVASIFHRIPASEARQQLAGWSVAPAKGTKNGRVRVTRTSSATVTGRCSSQSGGTGQHLSFEAPSPDDKVFEVEDLDPNADLIISADATHARLIQSCSI